MVSNSISRQAQKEALGKVAAELIEDGMVVGLGTGTTAACFIKSLIKRCQNGLRITAVATSEASQRQAAEGGIRVLDLNDVPHIDIDIDGTDEIDPKKRLIKGAGGALLREKILALSSGEMIVVTESIKLVKKLGAVPLPVEIVKYGYKSTLKRIEAIGYKAPLRKTKSNEFYVTDNGNYIADIAFKNLLNDPEKVHEELINVTGVVDTGFFFKIVGRVIVAYQDGRVEIKKELES
jgi:ribose 5-phosphate isomerase A